MPSEVAFWPLLGKARSSHQRVWISTVHRVLSYSLAVVSPQWATESISTNLGLCLFQSAKVRMGMASLSKLPGLVVPRPRWRSLLRARLRRRSMVAALIGSSWALVLGAMVSSPCLSRAATSSGPYVPRRPILFPLNLGCPFRKRWMAYLRLVRFSMRQYLFTKLDYL